jgi:hypothetical protein
MQNLRLHPPVRAGKKIGNLRKKTTNLSLAAMKARQSSKIREIGKALISTGFVSLDAQAKVLGLPRSTAWTIRAAEHKGTGISARIICRMLSSAQLPALARVKIMEYAEEKAAGVYGGTKTQRRRFASKLRFYGLDERPKRMAA